MVAPLTSWLQSGNPLRHSPALAYLHVPAHRDGLGTIRAVGRTNPMGKPLETVLAVQPPSALGPLDPALRDYILLITILVAFLESTAQQLQPIQPAVVMRLNGSTTRNVADTPA